MANPHKQRKVLPFDVIDGPSRKLALDQRFIELDHCYDLGEFR
jgi:hypothetical protein